MSNRTKSAFCAAALTCLGVAAFAASGFGDDPMTTGHYKTMKVEMAPAPTPAATSRDLSLDRRGRRGPRITNLITRQPLTVPAGDELVAILKCTKRQGVPLSGGVISPPAPAQVAASVISRFSPNPPYRQSARRYYVGVRNFGGEDEQFHATLVCAKGVRESVG